jgi:hypothetical protein
MRRAVSAALACLAALALVLAAAATWTTRTALDTGQFVALTGPVIDQQPVRDALATDVADQLVRLVAVPALKPLAEREAATVVASPSFRPLWFSALATAHREVVAVLEGTDQSLTTTAGNGTSTGEVRLDLIAVVADVLHRLPPTATALLGRAGGLRVPAGATAAQLRASVAKFLGVPLPAGFATVPLLPTSALHVARTAVHVLDGAAPVLLVVGAVLLALSLVLARRRSTTFVWFGLALAACTAVGYLAARAVGAGVTDGLTSGPMQTVATAIQEALFDSLRTPATVLAVGGAVLAAVALAAGAAGRRG